MSAAAPDAARGKTIAIIIIIIIKRSCSLRSSFFLIL